MKYIGITPEGFLPHEGDLIAALLDHGLDRLHLRKPGASRHEVEELLHSIPDRCYNRIVLHDHFELAVAYRLAGVHLNRRNPMPPAAVPGYTPALSRSCHTLDELGQGEGYTYQFLSPLFDSLSKQGYRAAFTPGQLAEAAERGIINERVVALGGITPERMAAVRQWHFGGVALLGYLWQEPTPEGVIDRLNRIRTV